MHLQNSVLRHLTRSFVLTALVVALGVIIVPQTSPSVDAATGQGGVQQVTLNPGGGVQTNGSDGLRFTINADAGGSSYDSAVAGQDGVVYRATRQYCCSAGAPMLNIGGTLYGQAGPAYSPGANWTSIEIVSTSGATSIGPRTSTTGNSSAVVRYTAVQGGRTYTITRTVSYTYPNDYVDDSYSFSIPDGNTSTVKFYLGGDTAPGSSDSGYGVMLTSPVRSVISLNTFSQIMFGFREVPGSKIFDGATSQSYSAPYSTVQTGGNIGYVVTASNHDAGLMMQWNLGSTPGTQTATLQQFATQQGTNLNASFATAGAAPGEPVNLNISIANTVLSTASGLGYTLTLPSGLVVGSGSTANTCSGTLTATAGSGSIALSSGSVGSAANCLVTVPVVAASNGTYTISAASISGLSGLTNNVGTSSITVTDDDDGDGIRNDIEAAAPNSGDSNEDGTDDADQLHVTSLVNTLSNTYATLVVNDACELSNVRVARTTELAPDNGYDYPLGLLDFEADCRTPGFTTTVTQYYYNPPSGDFVLRKYANGAYQTVNGATMTRQTVGGQSVLVVSYQVTDGGILDADGLVNGVIVDPAGPATLAITTVSSTASVAAPGTPNTGLQRVNIHVFTAALVAGLIVLLYKLIPLSNRARRRTQKAT